MSKGKRVRKKPRKKTGVMDLILIIVAIVLIAYTVACLIIFVRVGLEPSTLTTCVFAAATGELGVMGWIKHNKDRQRERKWEKEDRAQAKKEQEDLNNEHCNDSQDPH